jgi:hypothetical protein
VREKNKQQHIIYNRGTMNKTQLDFRRAGEREVLREKGKRKERSERAREREREHQSRAFEIVFQQIRRVLSF